MRTTIEMAREAGFTDGELAFMQDNFLLFAELVRADERAAQAAARIAITHLQAVLNQCGCGRGTLFEMVRDIESKLKEKNT